MKWIGLIAGPAVALVAAAGNATEEVGAYGAMGVALAVLLFFFRRWSKMRDDAIVAAQDADARARGEAAVILAAVTARHDGDTALLKMELARMRSVMAKILSALTDDLMTPEQRRELRAEAMLVLFPPSDRQGGK